MLPLGLVLLAVGVWPAQEKSPGPEQVEMKLWAAISVSHPVFDPREESGTPFLIRLAIVNDGTKTVDPDLDSSQLLINGKEVGKDWSFTISQGPRDDWSKALPPGEHIAMTLSLGRDFQDSLGRHFGKPGVYRVALKGKGYQSSDVVFRMMPRDRK